LSEAKKKLDEINLTEEERIAYKAYLKNLRDIASEQHTKMVDAKILIDESIDIGKDIKERQAIIGFFKNGVSVEIIANSLNISEKSVRQIIEEEYKNGV